MIDKTTTELHLNDIEYKEFLKQSSFDLQAKEEDEEIKTKYRVFFWCDNCLHAFTEVAPQIISAAMKIDLCGCPKCHSARQVKLTHHSLIKTQAEEEIDITEFVKVVPL